MPQQNPMLEHLRPKCQRNLLWNAPLSIRYHRAHNLLLEHQCYRYSYHRHRFVNLLLIHNQQMLPPPRVRSMLYLFLLVPASKHPVTRMRPTHILHIMDTQDITILLIHILLLHNLTRKNKGHPASTKNTPSPPIGTKNYYPKSDFPVESKRLNISSPKPSPG